MSVALPDAGGRHRTAALIRAVQGIADTCHELVGRVFTGPRMHALARLPLARPISRRSAVRVFDLVAGFTHSQTLVALLRLGVLDALREAPLTVDALASAAELEPEPMGRLCAAGSAIGLLRLRVDGRVALTLDGRAILGDPGILAMVEHNQLLYRDLADPVALLRSPGGGELARFWPYDDGAERAALDGDEAGRYSELMAASQSFIAHEVLRAYDFTLHRRVMDVGGGNGAFLRAALAEAPALEAVLADLPAVAELAERCFASHGMAPRVDCRGVDFFRDPLPEGADLITLVRVLHDHDDAGAIALLRKVHDALPDYGRLLVAEPMRDEPSAQRIADVYFYFYFLAMGRGRARSRDEIAQLCRAAGFTRFEARRTNVPLQTSVLVVRK